MRSENGFLLKQKFTSILGMRFTAKYANNCRTIHIILPMRRAGFYYHSALDAFLPPIDSNNIFGRSLKVDQNCTLLTARKDFSVH